jgi:hypothetical protein
MRSESEQLFGLGLEKGRGDTRFGTAWEAMGLSVCRALCFDVMILGSPNIQGVE